jgi:hypothetical protein
MNSRFKKTLSIARIFISIVRIGRFSNQKWGMFADRKLSRYGDFWLLSFEVKTTFFLIVRKWGFCANTARGGG